MLLYSKDCARLGLMKGCECIVEQIVFADEEESLPDVVVAGVPIWLSHMSVSLLLRAVDALWMLPRTQLPRLPNGFDRRGLFQILPQTQHFKYVPSGKEKSFHVRHTQFKGVPASTRVVYAAQGEALACTARGRAVRHWLPVSKCLATP